MTRYSTEPRTRKYVKRIWNFVIFKTSIQKHRKELLDTGLDSLQTASRKVVYKIAEFIVNKTSGVIAKQNDYIIVKTKPVEEIIIPPEKKRGNIKRIKTSITKMEYYKISKLLNDSTTSKFVKKMDRSK